MKFETLYDENGGAASPLGFFANGIHCGIRKKADKKDLMLLYSEKECDAAAVFTRNLVKGAPVVLSERHLKNGRAQAVICNSGIANTCCEDGIKIARKMCELTAKRLMIEPDNVLVASTGVIGERLDIAPIRAALPELVSGLSKVGGAAAAEAIMTTDTVKKHCSAVFELDGRRCTIGAVAKGSGMINPNMATMLSFITTDADISAEMLKSALYWCVRQSFNMLSIDGDTSTNDTVAILANGKCGNRRIENKNTQFFAFRETLLKICLNLVRKLAKDGEGATKLIVCNVSGAESKNDARLLAKAVISSPLVKTAVFGADANWGRILCALGYSGAESGAQFADVSVSSKCGRVALCKEGCGLPFSEEEAKRVLSADEITIFVELHSGKYEAEAYGCDLSYDYVRINGDYRS